MIRDVLGEPAALPLLQFTLLKLWDLRQRNLVTWSAYHTLGNAREALNHAADEFYKSLIQEEREEVKRLLLNLVRPTEGWEVTSRRIRRDDLLQSDNRERAQCVLDKLIKARLVRLTRGETPADDQVEVAHEALVRHWKQLFDWLVEERSKNQRRLELTFAVSRWQDCNEDRDALLRGSLLKEVRAYTDLNALESRFVGASEAAEREEMLRQQGELEVKLAKEQLEAKLAEEQRLRGNQQQELSKIQRRVELTFAAIRWLDWNEDRDALLRGSLLKEARAYTDLNALESRFVGASEAAEREEMLRQQGELEAKLAKEQLEAKLAEEQRLRAKQQQKAGGDRLRTTRMFPQDSKARDADVSVHDRNATRDGNNEHKRPSLPMRPTRMFGGESAS